MHVYISIYVNKILFASHIYHNNIKYRTIETIK